MNDKCERNKIQVIVRSGLFRTASVSHELGDHQWGKWDEPVFRAQEWRKVGKKQEALGYRYQKKTCELCGLVIQRQI